MWTRLQMGTKSGFLDRGVPVTQPWMTWNFACEDQVGGIFDFCSSQGLMTSTKAKPVLASKHDQPL